MVCTNDEHYNIYAQSIRTVTLPREYLEYLFKSPNYNLFITRVLDFVSAVLDERENEMIKELQRKGVI